MYRFHLARNLRSLVFLIVLTTIMAGAGVLWWANRTGLPSSWRTSIESIIQKKGAFVRIGGLRYHPLRGVVASNVRVFSDASCLHEVSRLETVLLAFDKTKLARGIVDLTKIELKDATLTLPIDPQDANSETLGITGINGTLFMPGGRRFEVRNACGKIAGIEINIDARVIGYQKESSTPERDLLEKNRRQMIARILGELNKCHFDPVSPPKLRITLEGDVNDNNSLNAKFTLQAKKVGKNDHLLKELSVEAEISRDLLTVTSLSATDAQGSLQGHADYDLGNCEGRFDMRSSLEIPPLLKDWLGLQPIRDVVIGGKQFLEVEGEYHLDENNAPQVQLTGHARCNAVRARGINFDTVESAFSWKDGELFLRDLHIFRPDGEAHGKVLIQWPLVRLAAQCTLPSFVYQPFFIGQPLEKVINDFTMRKDASFNVGLEGAFDASDPFSWAYTGGGVVKNVNYKGVPVNLVECRFSLSHRELDFSDGTVVFNYQNYPLREAYGGPRQGTAKVRRVRYDAPSKTVDVEDVTGSIWAAPLVRLFAPKIADSLEIYRFRQPPALKGSGVVDVTSQGRTVLDVSFNSSSEADYRFLGENISLSQPVGKVAIRGDRVIVDPLQFAAFGGPVSARFESPTKSKIGGELSWTKLSIPALASTYGFQMKDGGQVTGRLDFSLTEGQVETMSGEGLLALENTELFAVPIFGPLSPLVSGILGNKRIGFQRADSAFCNFKIKDGILSTRDFNTATNSLVFVGDGSVDLKNQTLDMTMRMNARGLLGLITLPLRPFYGMFQFRGTGPLKETRWENVMFTTPPEGQDNLLTAPPKAKVVNQRR